MTTPIRRYYRGANLVSMVDVQANKKYVYHFDHQGTTQCLTDATTGAVTDRFASDAWGVPVKRTGSSINRQWYVGGASVPLQMSPVTNRLLLSGSTTIDTMRGRLLSKHGANRPDGITSDYPIQPAVLPSLLAAFQPPKSDRYRLVLEAASPGPVVFNQCGGASWRVYWGLRDSKGRPPSRDRDEVYGWIVQRVLVTGKVRDCNDNALAFPNGCSYFEAWPVRIEKNKPGTVTIQLRNDTFGWSGTREPSQGSWKIEGNAVFIETPFPQRNPPGDGWETGDLAKLKKTNCDGWSAGDLKFTESEPPGFKERSDASNQSVAHSLELEWRCAGCAPDFRCECDRCESSPKRARKCTGC